MLLPETLCGALLFERAFRCGVVSVDLIQGCRDGSFYDAMRTRYFLTLAVLLLELWFEYLSWWI